MELPKVTTIPVVGPIKEIRLPHSKSILIRKLIYRFLYDDQILPVDYEETEDVKIVWHNLRTIKEHLGTTNFVAIEVKDCGAAYRFLLSVLAVTPGKWFLTGTEQLLRRPIQELCEVLTNIGACLEITANGIKINGKCLHAEKLTVDCSRSSQFASSLLLIGKKIGLQQLEITPRQVSSEGYIELTEKIIYEEENLIVNQKETEVEADWSAAVYWYAKSVLNAPVSYQLKNLQLHSIQSDAIVASWFQSLGVTSFQKAKDLIIYSEKIEITEPMVLLVDQNLDLVPVLACLACVLPCRIIFKGIQNLSYKESDRMSVIREQLAPYADIILQDNQILSICGKENKQLRTLHFNPHQDHRFVMGFSLFSKMGTVEIDHFDCVKKSYPHFIEER